MSRKAKTSRKRRKRRQDKTFIRDGAKPVHKGRSGRTGAMREKKNQSLKDHADKMKKRQEKQSPPGAVK